MEVDKLPDFCRDLLKQWKSVLRYLTVHSRRQENQGVHNKVQSFEWSLISDEFFSVRLEIFQRLINDCEYAMLRFAPVTCPDMDSFGFVFQTSQVSPSISLIDGTLPSTSAGRFAGSSAGFAFGCMSPTLSISRVLGFSCWVFGLATGN